MAKKSDVVESKLSIPGVNITELLELEDIFVDLKTHLAKIMIIVVIIAQIRISLITSKPAVIQGLESVNTYIKTFLSKSPSIIYVCAAVSIRRTLAIYANDKDPSQLLSDFKDLTENLSGTVTTRGGLNSALASKEKMRAYRRGLMAQTTGSIQSIPIHYPRRLSVDIEKINSENFLSYLPFPTGELKIEPLFDSISQTLLLDIETNKRVFNDFPNVSSILMEQNLPIKRETPVFPNTSKLPTDSKGLPSWRSAAISQAKKINPGG